MHDISIYMYIDQDGILGKLMASHLVSSILMAFFMAKGYDIRHGKIGFVSNESM